MGLLDNFNLEDPRTMGLLNAGLNMLGNSGASRTPVNLGQILGGGLQSYTGTLDDFRKRKQQEEELARVAKMQDLQRQQEQLQLGGMQRKNEMDAAIRDVYKKTSPDMSSLAKDLRGIGAYEQAMDWQIKTAKQEEEFGSPQYGVDAQGKPFTYVIGKRGTQKVIPNTFQKPDDLTPYQKAQIANDKARLAQSDRQHAARLALDSQKLGAERKPMTALQEAKYRDQLAGDYKALDAAISTMNDVSKSSQSLLDNQKGLSGVTGLQSYFPSMPNSAAAKADVSLQNLKGKITQLGKVAASSGGAIGTIANQEWKIMSDMVAAIDPSKGDAPMKDQIKELNSYAEGAARRMADAYDKQYSVDFEAYPQFKTPSLVDVSRVPKDAVNMLKMNPKLRNDFDAKYGAGAASRILGQ